MLVCPVSSNAFPMTTLSVLEHSKHEPLKAAVHLFLRPNLIRFATDRQPPDMMAARLSHCYISLSTAILNLSILDLPVDPATVWRNIRTKRLIFCRLSRFSIMHGDVEPLLRVSAIGLRAAISSLTRPAAAVHAAYKQALRFLTMDRTRQNMITRRYTNVAPSIMMSPQKLNWNTNSFWNCSRQHYKTGVANVGRHLCVTQNIRPPSFLYKICSCHLE